MDLVMCCQLKFPYNRVRGVAIEEFLALGKKPSALYFPVVWRGRHSKSGSMGYIFETDYHTGLIILLAQLVLLEGLPSTRIQLLDATDDESISLMSNTRSRVREGGLHPREQEFFSSGWFVSSASADYDGIGVVTHNPDIYIFDEYDLRIMAILGIDSRNVDQLDPISW